MKESPGPLRTFPELSGCPESALLHGSGLFLSFCHGGYRVAGVPRSGAGGGVPSAVACPLGRSPILPFTYFPAPSPRPRSQSALPSGKGETQSFLMQGASPLASPGLSPWFTAKRQEAVPCEWYRPESTAGHLFGKVCKCRSRSNARGAGGGAPGEIN